ncbi:Basic leucine zipper 63 [Platanthera guangdongensis]|uniref:Basic leucine zipper 63 n=1 Tax=Platanthera guangdongensis TaxID=2320717 RepID=A0ABR2N239_9ASPA
MPSSSGSTQLQKYSVTPAQRMEKRMLSNRESARRSRMRKQKQLEDLMARVSYLRQQNNQILSALNITAQHCLGVEAENSVLRARLIHLASRLHFLQDLIHCINAEDSSTLLRPSAALLTNQPLIRFDPFN